jgi:type IV pilus assembly protein PilA
MKNLLRKSRKGFTLIELMIVVAIIGILAAIAIPNFLRFQLKAKSSEGKVNIAAVRTTETSYHAELGVYVSADPEPPVANIGTAKVNFNDTAAGFATLGWSPEGQVYFSYGITTTADFVGYTVTAEADIDGDGTPQAWGYGKPDATPAIGNGKHATCAVGNLTDNTVMACDGTFGQSVF